MNTDKFIAWRQRERERAQRRGEPFFLGWPCAWYATRNLACLNGHVATCFLKSEVNGALCLKCRARVFLVPVISETQLQAILFPKGAAATRKAGQLRRIDAKLVKCSLNDYRPNRAAHWEKRALKWHRAWKREQATT